MEKLKCLLGMALTLLLSQPSPSKGAPAYSARHPQRQPPCTHHTHPSLCWTVQLKPPLHYKVPRFPAENSKTRNTFLVRDSEMNALHDSETKYANLHDPSTADDVLLSGEGTDISQGDVDNVDKNNIGYKSGRESRSSVNAKDADLPQMKMNLTVQFKSPVKSVKRTSISQNVSKDSSRAESLFDSELYGESNKEGEKGTRNSHSSSYKETLHFRENFQDKNNNNETPHHQKVYVYHQMALQLAQEVGLSLLGKVGELYDHFLLCHEGEMTETTGREASVEKSRQSDKAFQVYHKVHVDLKKSDVSSFDQIARQMETSLERHHDVAWFAMETVHHRQKRSLTFNDPKFSLQWHLVNHRQIRMDINVTGVWNQGITGEGVTVAVVDDGLEWNNPDLRDNYNYRGSWDLNDNDPDPMPDASKMSNHHGTRCAGEIAAGANNSVCGVGVAYGAKVAGIRLLDGPMTDSLEAEAFNKKFDINAIYSCSWGPDDDGKTVDGPHILAAKAMKYGVEFGRHGYGSIFVVASGNGGSKQDNCNYDGYANSIYTVTIGAVDASGAMPYYAEECASMLGVTFSSGLDPRHEIVTTDWRQRGGTGCTEKHSGTSAAAPLAAGMIALMLDAQPCLTWRDVQYILIITSVKIDVDLAHWKTNTAGLEHSHKHGFGLISAWRMVNAARVWKSVPWMSSYSQEDAQGWVIPHNDTLTVTHTVTSADISGYSLYMLEYIQVTVTLTHPYRGMLGIMLHCPSGTSSKIGAQRPHDNSTEGFSHWTFTTVRCWGEPPTGNWTMVITDYLPRESSLPEGHLSRWRLTLFGTPMTTTEFKQRKAEVERAMSGEFLTVNHTPHCEPPPVTSPPYIPLSEKTLKIVFLASVFCAVFALYETLEYMLCYGEEKQQQAEDTQRAIAQQQAASDAMTPETAHLLASDHHDGDSTWLPQSQSTFDEDEEDDMFLLDSGIATQLGRGYRRNNSTQNRERIGMLALRTLPERTRASTDRSLSLHHGSSPGIHSQNGASRMSSAFNDLGEVQGQTDSAVESHPGGRFTRRAAKKSSVLPDLWRSLTADRTRAAEGEGGSGEDEVMDNERDSSVALLRNGVRKTYR